MRLLALIKKIGSAVILSMICFSVFGTLAYAQNAGTSGVDCTKEYCPLTTLPGAYDACTADKAGNITCPSKTDPIKVIKNIYGISIGIGAILAVVMIIWAGVEYATTESITGHSDAKEKWQGALFGLLLLLASYIILRTINADLVNINLDLGKPTQGTRTQANGLQDWAKGLEKNAAELKAAVEEAQKKVSDIEKQSPDIPKQSVDIEKQRADLRKKLDEMIAKGDIGSPEYSNIEGQINALDTQEMHEKQAKAAQIQLHITTLEEKSIGAFNVIESAFNGSPTTAQSIARATRAAMQKELDALKSAGASDEVIKSATTYMSMTNVILNKALETGSGLQNITPSNTGNYYYLSTDTIKQREALRQAVETSAVAAIRQDYSNKDAYELFAAGLTQTYDRKLAEKLRCKGGIRVSLTKIDCAI